MTQEKATRLVANLTLSANQPTIVAREALFNWIVWQFPTLKNGNLCAAVHPPLPGYGWLPAVIKGEKNVQVFAHLDAPFESPETAVDYFTGKTEES
ncbi:MAG: hypothetical protein R3E31_01400 [Chloroflexota bacterium]|nr:hypothetical protein [Ardenticatenaceae bacterium]